MAEDTARKARIASVVFATCVSLACGTNYAYSAWSPAFGSYMRLSATESNLIGVAGNLGMYAMGIPAGLLIDRKGPRWGVLLGATCLACGYFPIQQAYVWGPFSVPISLIRFCSFLTGFGSCCSFSAAIKTATFNWPGSRGTATSFPLSGFGLSAFFFATIASFAFGEDIGGFLLLLSIGTLCLNLIALPFVKLIPSRLGRSSEPKGDGQNDPNHSRRRAKTVESQRSPSPYDEGEQIGSFKPQSVCRDNSEAGTGSAEQPSPLTPGPAVPDEEAPRSSGHMHEDSRPTVEITGFALMREYEFWQLFLLLGVLAGIGLMTINNIGNDTKALWRHYDSRVTPSFLQSREQLHVSILSLGSFGGRLISGIGSDFLVRRRASRFWCITASSLIFIVAQVIAIYMKNPKYLYYVSSLTGLGYGALFGVFPALVADAFGINGLSLNWGFMIFSPVISSYGFNYWYGFVYDDHSHTINDGTVDCPDGLDCYQSAYHVTFVASVVGMLVSLWCIRHERKKKKTIARTNSREE